MKAIKRNNGFSLLEVLIAITIFGITLFGVLPLIITSIEVTSGTSLKSKAQIRAAEKLDELKSWSSTEIEWFLGNNASASGSDTISEGGIILEREWRIDSTTFDLGGSLAPSYFITVRVSYTNQNGEPFTKILSTVWGY